MDPILILLIQAQPHSELLLGNLDIFCLFSSLEKTFSLVAFCCLLPVESNASDAHPQRLLFSSRRLVAAGEQSHLPDRQRDVPDYAFEPTCSPLFMGLNSSLKSTPASNNGVDTTASMEPSSSCLHYVLFYGIFILVQQRLLLRDTFRLQPFTHCKPPPPPCTVVHTSRW